MKEIFDIVSIKCSKLTTRSYSTSFSLGVLCLSRKIRNSIYAIYGFVRFADEIVDTFHNYDKATLLARFKKETYLSIQEGISLNPILNSFQQTVKTYNIDLPLIDSFLKSMEMDLSQKEHSQESFEVYVLGSAEVVGLMCLKVFCNGDERLYTQLKPYAMSLGSAFQKVNFLRDLKDDFEGLGRTYFPGVDLHRFTDEDKRKIQQSIEKDFTHALEGIKQLPRTAKFGVYIAYTYYRALFRKIINMPSHRVLTRRIRIPNRRKATLLAFSYVKHRLNLI